MGVFDPVKDAIKTVDKLNPLSGDQQDDQRDGGDEQAVERVAAPEEARPVEESEQVRVSRAEEELEVGTTEREAGSVGVHKTVETEKVRAAVPVRREEARVERVRVDQPVEDAAIGEEVVRVPVYEEETVVTKRPVVKEEIRITKESRNDVEHVSENVRKEQVDVDGAAQNG